MKNLFKSTAELKQHLDQGKIGSTYILEGPQTFVLDEAIRLLSRYVLPEADQGVNLHVYDGKETSMQQLLLQAAALPMWGERQLIIVRYLDQMAAFHHKEGQKHFLHYLKSPSPHTVLVLVHPNKVLKKRAWLETEKKQLFFLSTSQLKEREIPAWIRAYAKKKGHEIAPEAVMILEGFLGTDLDQLARSMDKMCISLEKGAILSADCVKAHVGMQKEQNIFELQKAIGKRDSDKAFRILYYLQKERKAIGIPLIALLTKFFCQMLRVHVLGKTSSSQLALSLGVPVFFVKDYQEAARRYSVSQIKASLKALYEADLSAKGIKKAALSEEGLLKDLLTKLFSQSGYSSLSSSK